MFRKLRIKLSLMFNRHAITTHQFQKNTIDDVVGEFSGRYAYSIPALSTIWAEATPVSKDRYAITEKVHHTHRSFGVSGRSEFYQEGVSGGYNDEPRKTVFSRDEAIEVLKALEQGFEKEGYTASSKQPFKKRIYTEQKAPTPKAS